MSWRAPAATLLAATTSFLACERRGPSEGPAEILIHSSPRESSELFVDTGNNSVNYFLYRGRLMGFDYELTEMAARDLGVHLEMVVPPRFADLIPWLLEGRGDVIAASMTITPARHEQIAFTRP